MGKTVFVLGAGASKDFGAAMPIGAELAAAIDAMLISEFADGSMSSAGLVKDALRRSGGLTGEHRQAALQIGSSLHTKPSIDELIDEWSDFPQFATVAKLAIAACLLRAEGQSGLMHKLEDKVAWATAFRPMRDSWASWLYQNVGGPSIQRRFAYRAFNHVAFVTFNYDRCLEQFLLANFMHACNLPLNDAAHALAQIEIHHAYGHLGRLAVDGHPQAVDFGTLEPFSVHRAASQIKTFTEEVETGAAERIWSTVQNADRLIFLGFGFHSRNLDLLFGTGRKCPELFVAGTSSLIGTRAWGATVDRLNSAKRQLWKNLFSKEFMQQHGEDALFH